MGANEKVHATFHPSSEPNPWTDGDVDAAARAMYYAENVEPWTSMPDWTRAPYLRRADAVLAALAPRLVERERAATARLEAAEGHLQAVREFAWGLGASTASRDQILRATEGQPFVVRRKP